MRPFYLGIPTLDGIFVVDLKRDQFVERVSLYRFEPVKDDEQKAYFCLYDAPSVHQMISKENWELYVKPACDYDTYPEKLIDGVETIKKGEARLSPVSGNWKVTKKAKIKYTESEKPGWQKKSKGKTCKFTTISSVQPQSPQQLDHVSSVADLGGFEVVSTQDTEQSSVQLVPAPTSTVPSTYTITLNAKPSDAGVVSVSPELATYDSGTQVTVTAAPNTNCGYVFKNWTGALTETDKQVVVTMDGNKVLTAVFEQKTQKQSEPTKKIPIGIIVVILAICACAIAAYFLFRPSVEKLFNNGKEAFNAGNFTEAVTYFSKAIKRAPDNAELRCWRGRAYYELNSYDPAVVDFKEAVRISPNVAEYHYRLGEAYVGGNNAESAVTAYTQAIKFDSSKADYYFGRAGAHSLQKAYRKSVDDFTNAIWLNPNDARYYNGRGLAHREMGNYEMARVDFAEAIRFDSSEAEYRNNRGDTYFLIKDIFAAHEDYGKAVQYDGGNEVYRKNREKTTNILEPVDSRDNRKYSAVQIPRVGGNIWMAQNMNYRVPAGNSWCYGNDDSNCGKYGRLYDWGTAKTVCMAGWHLPSRKEWEDLVAAVGVSSAGKKLKAVSPPEWNGTDDYKFSARPGGFRNVDGSFSAVGNGGSWWTATENDGKNASLQYMGSNYEKVFDMPSDKRNGLSVRCVRDGLSVK